jgi:predicted dehydrogenase
MIRAAIIGLGSWGQHLVRNVQGISSTIQFTAFATRTPAKAAEFAAANGLRMLENYEAALADPDIDAVVLATPHRQHTDQIVAAAAAGKHVFSEKPLGVNAAEAARAAQACADASVTLGVGYNWRYQPALREIRRLIDDGTLGRVLHLEGNFCGPSAYRFPQGHWRHDRQEGPAGGMTGRGVHVVDAMLYLAGHIEQVTAQSFRLVQDFGDKPAMILRHHGLLTVGRTVAEAFYWMYYLEQSCRIQIAAQSAGAFGGGRMGRAGLRGVSRQVSRNLVAATARKGLLGRSLAGRGWCLRLAICARAAGRGPCGREPLSPRSSHSSPTRRTRPGPCAAHRH